MHPVTKRMREHYAERLGEICNTAKSVDWEDEKDVLIVKPSRCKLFVICKYACINSE